MPSPFPGMDPYLEEPALWPGVHVNLAVALQEALVPLLRPRYYVTVELRAYDAPFQEVEFIAIGDVSIGRHRRPDGSGRAAGEAGNGRETVAARSPSRAIAVQLPRPVEVRERYLEIRRPGSHELITVIEILAPTNKRPGKGRQLYDEKRQELAATTVNLVEIDLLRTGEPFPLLRHMAVLDRTLVGDYRAVASRGHQRHRADLFAVTIREPLPVIPIPLSREDTEPLVDLGRILATVFDRGGYDLLVDYRQEPIPPLAPADAAWADALLRERGLR